MEIIFLKLESKMQYIPFFFNQLPLLTFLIWTALLLQLKLAEVNFCKSEIC